jgi:hypothetical protein
VCQLHCKNPIARENFCIYFIRRTLSKNSTLYRQNVWEPVESINISIGIKFFKTKGNNYSPFNWTQVCQLHCKNDIAWKNIFLHLFYNKNSNLDRQTVWKPVERINLLIKIEFFKTKGNNCSVFDWTRVCQVHCKNPIAH